MPLTATTPPSASPEEILSVKVTKVITSGLLPPPGLGGWPSFEAPSFINNEAAPSFALVAKLGTTDLDIAAFITQSCAPSVRPSAVHSPTLPHARRRHNDGSCSNPTAAVPARVLVFTGLRCIWRYLSARLDRRRAQI